MTIIRTSQLRAIKSLVDILVEVGVQFIDVTTCPECGTVSFADDAHCSHVCAFCGHGPWQTHERPGMADAIAQVTSELQAIPVDNGRNQKKGTGQ